MLSVPSHLRMPRCPRTGTAAQATCGSGCTKIPLFIPLFYTQRKPEWFSHLSAAAPGQAGCSHGETPDSPAGPVPTAAAGLALCTGHLGDAPVPIKAPFTSSRALGSRRCLVSSSSANPWGLLFFLNKGEVLFQPQMEKIREAGGGIGAPGSDLPLFLATGFW